MSSDVFSLSLMVGLASLSEVGGEKGLELFLLCIFLSLHSPTLEQLTKI